MTVGVCVSLLVVPKAGVFVAAGVPLQLSVVVGQVLAIVGWLVVLRRPNSIEPQLGLALLGVCSVVWIGHFVVLLEFGDFDGLRPLARAAFNLLAVSALGVAFWVGRRVPVELLIRGVRYSFYALLLYAIAQILLGPETVAIRYVTAGYESVFDEVLRSSNVLQRVDRSSVKIFGTYQNGNLFAVALLLIGPIAIWSERRVPVRIVALIAVHIVMIYAASTAGYIGLLVWDVLLLLGQPKLRRYVPIVVAAGCVAIGVGAAASVCQQGSCRAADLLDAKLFERDFTQNARWNKLGDWLERVEEQPWRLLVGEMSDLSATPIFESLPFSFAQNYGLPATVLFYLFVLSMLRPWRLRPYKFGVVGYLVMSIGSGGFWLAPTPYVLGLVLGVAYVLDRHELRRIRTAGREGALLGPDDPRSTIASNQRWAQS
ncbi:MAG: hypothetical protein AAGA42_10710 [Actinomycetota bacterium]